MGDLMRDDVDRFIKSVENNPSITYTVFFGLKAAPLTLVHEEIIIRLVNEFVTKYKNVHLRIGVADSEWKKSFDLVNMVQQFVESCPSIPSKTELMAKFSEKDSNDWHNNRIDVINQCCWNGLYSWLKDNQFNAGQTLVVVGEDEWLDLNSRVGRWVDAEKFLKEYQFYCIKSRSDNSISASAAREIFYRDPDVDYFYVKNLISRWSYNWIKKNGLFWQLKENYRAEEDCFVKAYNPDRYPRPSVTVDNVVWDEINGERVVLLVRRGGHPFKGFWALPGGFLDIYTDFNLKDAALRELQEETNLHGSECYPIQFRTYSDIGTDPRTRIVDVVYTTKVDSASIEVKGGDDAVDAVFFSINNLPRMAFNHAQIIREFFETIPVK